MKPALALARKAQRAPNSAGSPKRRAELRAWASARAASSDIPRWPAARSIADRCRSVSKAPGLIELIVTLSRTCARAAEARKAVRPARAPDDTSSPAIGARTDAEVMLTMRPNFRWSRAIASKVLKDGPLLL